MSSQDSSLTSLIGCSSYLVSTEESYFVALLQFFPEFVLQIICKIALKLANDYFKSEGLSDTPLKKWLYSFLSNHDDECKWGREQTFNEEARSSWFEKFDGVMVKCDPLDEPHQIFNLDETKG
ncbi:unnamed protein product [Rotaria sp. Silwood2]|nr:unnamed protein product [Rotaria sp. Silwood2]CAF4056732.1 unnamed protein product [Rotaria sp. Silwood2]